jgi:ATP-dependent DNA helicase RecG
LQQALVQLHQPADLDHAENARERLTFDEAFLLQALLVIQPQSIKEVEFDFKKESIRRPA